MLNCLAGQMLGRQNGKVNAWRPGASNGNISEAGLCIPNSSSRIQLWEFRGLDLSWDFRLSLKVRFRDAPPQTCIPCRKLV